MLRIVSAKMDKKTIALDFDGVLHSYTSGWTGPVPEDPPVDGAQKFVEWLQDKYEVVLFSSRADTKAGIDGIKSWLKDHNFPALEVYHEKPAAEVYVDDRGFRFTGDFNKVKDFLGGDTSPWYGG